MQTLSYHTVDKTAWPPGPWHDEPDKVQWTDLETGYPCLAKRNPHSGFLCGYVGLPEGHKFFRLDYNDVDSAIDVHGGLTYADFCSPGPEATSICHIPAPGESDHVWWLGFDCGHYTDLAPGHSRDYIPDLIYRDLFYVKAQCAALARQLKDA